jgi:hypothetical protein
LGIITKKNNRPTAPDASGSLNTFFVMWALVSSIVVSATLGQL